LLKDHEPHGQPGIPDELLKDHEPHGQPGIPDALLKDHDARAPRRKANTYDSETHLTMHI